jgi:hypothetical protein
MSQRLSRFGILNQGDGPVSTKWSALLHRNLKVPSLNFGDCVSDLQQPTGGGGVGVCFAGIAAHRRHIQPVTEIPVSIFRTMTSESETCRAF